MRRSSAENLNTQLFTPCNLLNILKNKQTNSPGPAPCSGDQQWQHGDTGSSLNHHCPTVQQIMCHNDHYSLTFIPFPEQFITIKMSKQLQHREEMDVNKQAASIIKVLKSTKI